MTLTSGHAHLIPIVTVWFKKDGGTEVYWNGKKPELPKKITKYGDDYIYAP